jgi:vacuolar iron transporter family protein
MMVEATANTGDGHVYEPHIGGSRQYMRDIILGVNDGLVSTFLLVSGVVGGGLTSTDVLLTGVAGALAGMISMAIGEYLATKSQEEVFDAELALEAHHHVEHRDIERQQLREMLAEHGMSGEDLDTVVDIIDGDDAVMLSMHKALEFGIVDEERRSPYAAAATSGFLFLGGAIPSVLPFAFFESTSTALILAAVLTGIGMFAVGVAKTVQTRKNPFLSGGENLALGFVGGAVAFGVGSAFGAAVG